jgi:hypothetical protein
MLGMSTLPSTCAVAVSQREGPAKGTSNEVKRLAVVLADSDSLGISKSEAALGENVKGASLMSTTVPLACLAEVMKESGHGDTVGR